MLNVRISKFEYFPALTGFNYQAPHIGYSIFAIRYFLTLHQNEFTQQIQRIGGG